MYNWITTGDNVCSLYEVAVYMSSVIAPQADKSPWMEVTRGIVCSSPIDALERFDASVKHAIDINDVESQLALSANALTFMLFHWSRFNGWQMWIERFEAAQVRLGERTDGVPQLTLLSGALATGLLRGDALEVLAPLGHRMESLIQSDADSIQVYLAAATALPWLQMSRNAAGAQALHARMLAINSSVIALNGADDSQGAHYVRGAWLASWAQHLLFSDHSRFTDALHAFDLFMLAEPVPLLQFRHSRLTTEKYILTQDMVAAEHSLIGMLAALHANRPMERVIYNSVATLIVGRGGDADRMHLHGSHIARDLVVADCPPALATVYRMSEARAHLVTQRYDLAAAAYSSCLRDAHSAHAGVYRGLTALAQIMLLDRNDAALLSELRDSLCVGLAAMRKEARSNFFVVALHARAIVCALALRENIEVEFIRDALARFPTSPPVWADENWPWALSLRTFGGFRAQGLIEEGRAASKVSNRPLSLLKLIAAHGRQGLTVADAADALWPLQDGDQAENSLSVTLLRLRKMHASADLIERRDGWLHLDATQVWTDVGALEAHLDIDAKSFSEAGRLDYINRLFDLYRGECLFGIEDDWAHQRAAHYRGRLTLATQQLLQRALEAGQTSAAELLMTRAHSRGLDIARLLNALHPGLRVTPAGLQLQRQLSLVGVP